MTQKVVTLPEIGEVILQKRNGSRSLRISIAATGKVKVTMPIWAPYEMGKQFANSKRSWVVKHRPEMQPINTGIRVGKAHRIEFIISASTTAPRSTMIGNTIRVFIPPFMDSTDPKVQSAALRGSLKALKHESQQLLPSRLRELALKHNFTYNSVTIKRLSTRWGSCDNHKNISLNCYLMQLPWDLIDYVLLHELTHTKIMAHGDKFWTELSNYVPNLAEKRKAIRKSRPSLMI